jgi:hypothetical protein
MAIQWPPKAVSNGLSVKPHQALLYVIVALFAHSPATVAAGNRSVVTTGPFCPQPANATARIEGQALGPHPRLWLTPGHVDNIRRKACLDSLGNPIPGCQQDTRLANFIDNMLPYDYWEKRAWHYALGYIVTGDAQYGYEAISAMDTTVAAITDQDRGQSNFLSIAANLRDTAIVFDWCYDLLQPDERLSYIAYMNQLMQELWNPFNNPTHTWTGWGIDDPGNNFYYSFLDATTYAALATYGENPDAPQLPFAGTVYTDMLEFVSAKIEQESIPFYLDTWGKGGAWHEGNNYGLLSKRYLLETFLLLRDVAARDYFQVTDFPREAVLYHLYSMEPGYQRVYPGGDLPRSTKPYDRSLMLWAADAFRGTAAGEYAQYFAANIETSEPWVQWPFLEPWDILLFDPAAPQRDFSELPLAYLAEGGGWMNSRSSWNNDAVSVSFVCTNRIQGHQAKDQNSFLIYKNGFQATHGNLHSNWGGYQNTDAYNTILINGIGQAFGGDWDDPTQTVRDIGNVYRFDSGPGFAYVAGDASDAYYTNAGQFGYGDERLLDTFTRELVHLHPGYVVVYDRITPRDASHIPTWLLITANQPNNTGNRISSADGARLYDWVMLPENPVIDIHPHPGGYSYEEWNTIDAWQTTVEPASAGAQHAFLNVLFVTDSSDTTTPTVSLVESQWGNMVGAEINDAGGSHIAMFVNASRYALPVADVVYDVTSNEGCEHTLFGLVPDGNYDVQIEPVELGTRVTVSITSQGSGIRSSSAGTLHFATSAPLNKAPDPAGITPGVAQNHLALLQNQPNPFNPTTRITMHLPTQCQVNLSIYDASGALIRTLIDDVLPAGSRSVVWDGRNQKGSEVGSGVYFYRLSSSAGVITRKMVLLK